MIDKSKIKEFLSKRKGKIYFIGICGSSMRSLAEYCLSEGFSVAGSDVSCQCAAGLRALGIRVYTAGRKERIISELPDLVVYTLSVSVTDPELIAAKGMGIPCISRAELLGAVIDSYAFSVGVIGTHGKSTVSAMLYRILLNSGRDVGAFIGASGDGVPSFCKGDGDFLVYEGCEYRDSFLHFCPTVNLVLSVDYDHTDYFETREAYRESFLKASELSRSFSVVNADSGGARYILQRSKNRCITFSACEGYDYRYLLSRTDGRYSVTVLRKDESLFSYTSPLYGEHNAVNSVAAAVTAHSIGIGVAHIIEALEGFRGIGRRLEKIGTFMDAPVYYDYAHHPSEIAALRGALCDMGYKRVAAVFAPHTYTRTRDFMEETALELSRFSATFITEIYGAREDPIVGISSSVLAEKTRGYGNKAISVTQKEVISKLRSCCFDCIALIGAGELELIKNEIEEK